MLAALMLAEVVPGTTSRPRFRLTLGAWRWRRRKASVQGDALAIGNLGMLYVRGQGVKENKIAGAALLLLSATLDRSPENHAKQNLSSTPGLTSEMVVAARALSEQFRSAKDLLVPLDQYLTESAHSTDKNGRPPH